MHRSRPVCGSYDYNLKTKKKGVFWGDIPKSPKSVNGVINGGGLTEISAIFRFLRIHGDFISFRKVFIPRSKINYPAYIHMQFLVNKTSAKFCQIFK